VLPAATHENTESLLIARLELSAPAGLARPLAAFHEERLGLPADGPLAFAEVADGSRPFHHVAFLVPAGRFDAAHAWAGARFDLLPHDGSTVVAFPAWHARACYLHDPAGNILELIAHDDEVAGAGSAAPFSPTELLGISEAGLVVADPAAAAEALRAGLGLELWAGGVAGPAPLGFVGRRAHTLILSAPGRGWLPTGRPAEIHPATVVLTGAGTDAEVAVGPHVIRTVRDAAPIAPA
jgi:catechol 2,3-dioxygenase-like lactoylglutathione lyase family enzyme